MKKSVKAQALSRQEFLGLQFVSSILDDVVNFLRWEFKNSREQALMVFTPNPEMVVEMTKNAEFGEVLKQADYLLPDGVGIIWMAKLLFGIKLQERITGSDLSKRIIEEFDKERIFVVGGSPGAAESLQKKYSNIVGMFDGVVDVVADQKQLVEKINSSGATVVLVALGAPKQEFWIAENIEKFESVKLLVGVGGSIDFLAGKQKRAPKFFQNFGLEWMYRLFKEPSRFKRIFNAVFVFGWICLKERFLGKKK